MFEYTAGPKCSRYKADKDRDAEQRTDETLLHEDVTVSDPIWT